VPAKPRPRKNPLEAALEALAGALSGLGAPWMIIGGIAIIARGVRRLTTDIDALVRGDAVTIPALLEALARYEISPRIEDAAAFARENLVLLLRHQPTRVDLDVSLGWSQFEHEALAVRSETCFGRVSVPMASAEDLVVFKAIASRPKDLVDAEALLVLHPIDVVRVRRRIAELAELAGAPELVDDFDGVLARARAGAKSSIRHGPSIRKPRRGRPE